MRLKVLTPVFVCFYYIAVCFVTIVLTSAVQLLNFAKIKNKKNLYVGNIFSVKIKEKDKDKMFH